MSTNIIEVAVGVLVNAHQEILFTQRPEGKPMAGYWEFPGGKLESGESVHDALARELHEEIGADIGASAHWRIVEHIYPHAHVRLHFQIIREWTGELHGKENQALHWQSLNFNKDGSIDAPDTQPILPATVPLLPELAAFLA